MAEQREDRTAHFSNAIIMWKISNISFTLCSKNYVVDSPEFVVTGPIETRWKMSLHKSHEHNKMVLYLEMLSLAAKSYYSASEDNINNMTVKVHWVANILDPTGERPMAVEHVYGFRVRNRFQVETFELSKALDILTQMEPDVLNFRCHMLLNFGFQIELPYSVSPGIVALSNALVKVLSDQTSFYQRVFYMSGFSFYVHFDMLMHRGERLRCLADLEVRCGVVNVLNYDGSCFGALIHYLYTGELRFLLTSPKIRISEYIQLFGIPEVQNLYPKERISIESNIEENKYVFNWRIPDFENIEDCLYGPEMYKEDMESRWQLSLYPKGPVEGNERQKKYVYLTLSLLECTKALDVCIEVASVDEQDQIIYSRKLRERMNAEDKREFHFFYRNGIVMSKCLINNSLSLRCTIRIATGKVIPIIENIHLPPPPDFDNSKSLKFFSSQMKIVSQTLQNADTTIDNEYDTLRAHRFLLAARSKHLKELVDFGLGIEIPDMRTLTLKAFHEYLYTGLLHDFEFATVYELRELGCRFAILELVNLCAAFLRPSPDNIIGILMYADDKKMSRFKTKALELIGLIGEDIVNHRDWKFFAGTKPALAADVLQYVQRICGNIPEEN